MADQSHKPQLSRKLILSIAALLVIAVAAVLALSRGRQSRVQDEGRQRLATQKAGPEVQVADAKKSEPERKLVLIGESRPFYSVTLFARVSGYLTKLLVDIGDEVKEGQLLARIESPEAEKAYQSALADATNKRRIADRMRKLLKQRLVSQQEADQSIAASRIADSTLETQKVIRGYQEVNAPFSGRITQRFADPGQLIQNASNSQSAAQALFTVSQVDHLRIFIYVDQKDAVFVKEGDPVEISLPAQAGSNVRAVVSRIAGELDPETRKLLVEVRLDNPKHEFVAGSFLSVTLQITTPSYIQLPVQALVIRKGETFVPVVGPDNELHYRKIDLAENDGTQLKIRSGIQEGDRAALNIGNTLSDGQKVRIAAKNPQQGENAAGTSGEKSGKGNGPGADATPAPSGSPGPSPSPAPTMSGQGSGK